MSGRVTPTPPPPPPPKGCELICANVFEEPAVQSASDADDELLQRREPTMQRRGKKLVAPPSQDARGRRYTLVLDLDETVVYGRDGPLYARAYLRDLLNAIKDSFEVIVWTAADREYAKNVLAGINVGHVVDHLIYRHRKWFKEEDYTKDLSQLGRDLNYTIIIENTPDCVRRNPGNSIIVEDFEVPVGAAEDREVTPTPTPPSPPQPSAEGPNSSSQSNGTATGETAPSPSFPSCPPKLKRATTDRTLLLLREVLEALAASGESVPVFLAHCELLSKQTVTGCDGDTIPIYYLGTRRRRRDAGTPRKVVKVNRDRAPAASSSSLSTASQIGNEEGETSQGDAITERRGGWGRRHGRCEGANDTSRGGE